MLFFIVRRLVVQGFFDNDAALHDGVCHRGAARQRRSCSARGTWMRRRPRREIFDFTLIIQFFGLQPIRPARGPYSISSRENSSRAKLRYCALFSRWLAEDPFLTGGAGVREGTCEIEGAQRARRFGCGGGADCVSGCLGPRARLQGAPAGRFFRCWCSR